jgi:hypothetical protein
LGNVASSAHERVNLFSNRLKRVHQTPDYKEFDDGWKVSVERYIKQYPLAFTQNPIARYLEPEHGDDSALLANPTHEEIISHLAKCKPKSAAGLDGISYRLLKRLIKEVGIGIAKC